MIMELMAALKAIPEIAQALREIGTGIKHASASQRRDKKDAALDEVLAAARTRRAAGRMRDEVERSAGGD
jgi:ribosomal protein S7